MLRTDVEARHGARAVGGLVQAREHVHGGSLTCAVGTKKAENLTLPDRETDVVNGMERPEGLHKV